MTVNAATRPVVAGLDGSATALRAAKLAGEEARARKAPLRLILATGSTRAGGAIQPPTGDEGAAELALQTAAHEDLRNITIIKDPTVVSLTWTRRRLVAALTRRADRVQHASPAYRVELRARTTRPIAAGDGIVPASIPHIEGWRPGEGPLRDFDTQGDGGLPPDPQSDVDQTMILLAITGDGPSDWLNVQTDPSAESASRSPGAEPRPVSDGRGGTKWF